MSAPWLNYIRPATEQIDAETSPLDTPSGMQRLNMIHDRARALYEADQVAADEPNGRHLRVLRASEHTPRRVRWLWDGRHALGTLSLTAGREGRGKSTLVAWKAARVTRGELPGEYLGQPRSVILVASEDSWEHTIVPRLVLAGADLDRVLRVEAVTHDNLTVPLTLPRDLYELEGIVTSEQVALIVLDPLTSRLAETLDSHRDADVRRALEPLAAVADRTGSAIDGLMHLNKSSGRDVLDRVMASKAFTAVARAVSVVVDDPDDEDGRRRLYGTPKNNLGRSDLSTLSFTIEAGSFDSGGETVTSGRVVWGADDPRSVADAIADAERDPDERTARAEAADWLRDYLGRHDGRADSAGIKDAAKDAGHSPETLKRARKAAGVRYHRHGSPSRTDWYDPALWHLVDRELVSRVSPDEARNQSGQGQSGQLPWGEGLTDLTDLTAGQGLAGPNVTQLVGSVGSAGSRPRARVPDCDCGSSETTTHPTLGTLCARCSNPIGATR